MIGKVVFFIALALFHQEISAQCSEKEFGGSSFVCVCNNDECELPGTLAELGDSEVLVYTNSRDDFRNEHQTKTTRGGEESGDITLTLDSTQTFQSIIGFGGAFTDSAGLNIKKLPEELQEMVMRAYFGPEGADYNLCRIPIAGSDFSTRPYSYDDVEGDTDLENFALTEEDIEYKFPYIKQALNLTEQDLFLFGSPWAPPAWMKTNGMFNGTGELLKEMYQPWAEYFVKFVQAYEKELGIEMWGLTTQNEPLSGYTDWAWNTCGWTGGDMRDWIAENLGPTLEEAGMRRVKLMVADYNRFLLPWYPEPMVTAENSSKYVDGIAVHWYDDKVISPEVLDITHDMAPSKFMLYTEGCSGFQKGDNGVILGSWERGEDYITDIIENLNHWQTGWVDWNIALDMEGGPNWAHNLVDAPIIINEKDSEFYMQPSYFALTHFSRFLKRDALKIQHELSDDNEGKIHATALKNPGGSIVIILANESDDSTVLDIIDEVGHVISEDLGARTWKTLHYKNSDN